jgi:hypothetical protein
MVAARDGDDQMIDGKNNLTPVPVPRDVRDGLEAVRRSGLTNMLDRPAVARIAAGMGYDACARWVEGNRALYARGVFCGFADEEQIGGAR